MVEAPDVCAALIAGMSRLRSTPEKISVSNLPRAYDRLQPEAASIQAFQCVTRSLRSRTMSPALIAFKIASSSLSRSDDIRSTRRCFTEFRSEEHTSELQ